MPSEHDAAWEESYNETTQQTQQQPTNRGHGVRRTVPCAFPVISPFSGCFRYSLADGTERAGVLAGSGHRPSGEGGGMVEGMYNISLVCIV